jgi:hypothetical protein
VVFRNIIPVFFRKTWDLFATCYGVERRQLIATAVLQVHGKRIAENEDSVLTLLNVRVVFIATL